MEDLIRRSDAIKAVAQDLMYESCIQSEYASDELSDWIEVAKVMLEEVPSADRWIPCSERLPEYGVPVLTWDGSMWTVEQRIPFILDDDFNRIYSEWWVDGYFDEDCEDAEYYPNLREGAAVAWMSLPEPWEGVDDGKDIQSEVE